MYLAVSVLEDERQHLTVRLMFISIIDFIHILTGTWRRQCVVLITLVFSFVLLFEEVGFLATIALVAQGYAW